MLTKPDLTTIDEAIRNARTFAASTGSPYTVWRTGDKFFTIPDADNVTKYIDTLVRPVAAYDPDGTEHR